jgi:hypothetical protein
MNESVADARSQEGNWTSLRKSPIVSCCNSSINKSNRRIQTPLTFVTEPRTRDNIFTIIPCFFCVFNCLKSTVCGHFVTSASGHQSDLGFTIRHIWDTLPSNAFIVQRTVVVERCGESCLVPFRLPPAVLALINFIYRNYVLTSQVSWLPNISYIFVITLINGVIYMLCKSRAASNQRIRALVRFGTI